MGGAELMFMCVMMVVVVVGEGQSGRALFMVRGGGFPCGRAHS